MTLAPKTPRKLALGFIGGSVESAVGYTHWVASQMDGVFKVVSGCFSRNPEVNRKTAREWSIGSERLYETWQDFIDGEHGKLDAVAVLTPTPNHVEVVCALLEAGYAVICEKAMVANLEQSRKVQAALEKSKGFLVVTFNYSGYPMVRCLRRHVQNGDLGNLLHVQIEMQSDAFLQPPEKMHPQAWRLQDGDIPTMLLDLAVHVHHLCGFLSERKPLDVNADFHHFSQFEGIVDNAYIWANYDKGMKASFWVSKASIGHRNGLRVRIFGDQGSGEWYQEEPERLHIFDKESRRMTYDRGNCAYPDEILDRFKPGHPAGFVEAFANLYRDIADALIQFQNKGTFKSPYVFGWDHADEGLRLLSCAAKANRARGWQQITDEGSAR